MLVTAIEEMHQPEFPLRPYDDRFEEFLYRFTLQLQAGAKAFAPTEMRGALPLSVRAEQDVPGYHSISDGPGMVEELRQLRLGGFDQRSVEAAD